MKLKSRSKLVRWAYLGDTIPQRVSLCTLFWRTVVLTPLCIFVVVWFIGAIAYMVFSFLRFSGKLVLENGFQIIFILICALSFLLLFLLVSWVRRRKVVPSILWEYIKAKEERVCPLIDIVKEDEENDVD